MKTYNKNTINYFPECTFQCNTREDLRNHINTDHQPIKCNICSESFETKEGANTHRRVKHPNIRPVEASRGADLETRKEGQDPLNKVLMSID